MLLAQPICFSRTQYHLLCFHVRYNGRERCRPAQLTCIALLLGGVWFDVNPPSLHYYDNKEDAAGTDPNGKIAMRDCHWHVNKSKPEQMLLGPIREVVRTTLRACSTDYLA